MRGERLRRSAGRYRQRQPLLRCTAGGDGSRRGWSAPLPRDRSSGAGGSNLGREVETEFCGFVFSFLVTGRFLLPLFLIPPPALPIPLAVRVAAGRMRASPEPFLGSSRRGCGAPGAAGPGPRWAAPGGSAMRRLRPPISPAASRRPSVAESPFACVRLSAHTHTPSRTEALTH